MSRMTSEERMECTLKGEIPDKVPTFDSSMIVMACSQGYEWEPVRLNPKLATEIALKYKKRVTADVMYGCLELNSMFMDMNLEMKRPQNNYVSMKSVLVTDPEKYETFELLDPYDRKSCPSLWNGMIQKTIDLAAAYDGESLVIGKCWGPYTVAGFLRGVEEFVLECLLNPDLAKKLIKRAAWFVDRVGRSILEGGSDGMWFSDPTASGDLISVDDYRTFCVPPNRGVIGGWKSDFKKPTFCHICGDTNDTLHAIPETGIDVFSVDYMVNMAKAKEYLSKNGVTLMGNVNPIKTMWLGTPEKVDAESKKCIEDAAEGGRYILGAGCDIPRDSPIENVIALAGASDKYGRYQ